ncbi:MAG TPA: septum site-determining protein MinC [Anaerolineaceae bacterium]|nr:septum site-determining protein MinC [Anaerolineaceae bacterium]
MADGQAKVQIKGIRDGLLVTLGEGDWPDLQANLLNQIREQASFYQGARLALDVGNKILRAADLGGLRDQLSDRGISLWAVISNSPTTEQTARVLGMATRLSTPKPDRPIRPLDTNLTGENAVLVQRTLRSGFKLVHQGHVVVIGDVNPGAEIIARGSVVIWGRLKGVVHAGADGDLSAMVCALELSPTQLRIASQIATTPQRRGKPQPEIAKIVNGHVVAEPWNPKNK